MRIKFLPAIMLASMVCTAAKAETYKVEFEGVKYTIDTSDEFNYAYATGPVDRMSENIRIAASVSYEDVEYPVRLIGMSAFNGCSNLATIELPSSLRWIDKFAFQNTGISSVTIPKEVESIGLSAFANCQKLEHIDMKGGGELGNFVFGNCQKLTEITLPAGIGPVSPIAFRGSKNLTSINVEDGCELYSSKDGILYSKDGKELKIYPWGKDLEPEIPEGVTSIGAQAFYQSPIQWIDMPKSLISIGEQAFYGCNGMDEIEIGESVQTIGQAAFQMCSQLTSISFPTSLDSIGSNAFNSCSKLKTVIIPDNVKSIGDMAFDYCSGLQSVKIGVGVETLPYGTFSYCSGLTQVEFSEGLKKIGNSAFSGCRSLSTLSLPNSLEEIEETAFWSCYSMKEIRLGKGLNKMGSLVFLGVTDLVDIYIEAEEPPVIEENTFATFAATLHVPETSLDAYKDDKVWGRFETITKLPTSSVNTQLSEMYSVKYIFNINGDLMEKYYGEIDKCLKTLPSGVYIVVDGEKTTKFVNK